jgi:hypothetical protein
MDPNYYPTYWTRHFSAWHFSAWLPFSTKSLAAFHTPHHYPSSLPLMQQLYESLGSACFWSLEPRFCSGACSLEPCLALWSLERHLEPFWSANGAWSDLLVWEPGARSVVFVWSVEPRGGIPRQSGPGGGGEARA